MGTKMEKWRWGDLHQAEFRNATLGESGIGFIEGIFNRGPVDLEGGNEPVYATRWSTDNPFTVRTISATRQIIDMSDLSSGLMMHVPGQSGHPAHRHYDDLIEPWRKVEFHPTLWEKSAVEAGARRRLVLEPR